MRQKNRCFANEQGDCVRILLGNDDYVLRITVNEYNEAVINAGVGTIKIYPRATNEVRIQIVN